MKRCFKDNDLNVRFCPEGEINKKRQETLIMKAQFSTKLKHLKSQGQKFQKLGKIETWVEENVDSLFEDRGLYK